MNSGIQPQPAEGALSQGAGEAEQLSAWLDGELPDPDADPVLARLLREPALQRRFEGWCLVGDALRSEEVLAGHSPRLCARIQAALCDEPALLAPAALRPRFKRHLASGIAVAAAAAVLVFVAVPQLRGIPGPAGTDGLASQGNAPAALANVSLGTPSDADSGVPAATRPARNPRLDPYIRAHRDFLGDGVMPAAEVYLLPANEGER